LQLDDTRIGVDRPSFKLETKARDLVFLLCGAQLRGMQVLLELGTV
jgi:hypothetical protein